MLNRVSKSLSVVFSTIFHPRNSPLKSIINRIKSLSSRLFEPFQLPTPPTTPSSVPVDEAPGAFLREIVAHTTPKPPKVDPSTTKTTKVTSNALPPLVEDSKRKGIEIPPFLQMSFLGVPSPTKASVGTSKSEETPLTWFTTRTDKQGCEWISLDKECYQSHLADFQKLVHNKMIVENEAPIHILGNLLNNQLEFDIFFKKILPPNIVECGIKTFRSPKGNITSQEINLILSDDTINGDLILDLDLDSVERIPQSSIPQEPPIIVRSLQAKLDYHLQGEKGKNEHYKISLQALDGHSNALDVNAYIDRLFETIRPYLPSEKNMPFLKRIAIKTARNFPIESSALFKANVREICFFPTKGHNGERVADLQPRYDVIKDEEGNILCSYPFGNLMYIDGDISEVRFGISGNINKLANFLKSWAKEKTIQSYSFFVKEGLLRFGYEKLSEESRNKKITERIMEIVTSSDFNTSLSRKELNAVILNLLFRKKIFYPEGKDKEDVNAYVRLFWNEEFPEHLLKNDNVENLIRFFWGNSIPQHLQNTLDVREFLKKEYGDVVPGRLYSDEQLAPLLNLICGDSIPGFEKEE